MSENSVVGPDPHRAEAHVEIGESNGAQAEPGKELMSPVEARDARIAGPSEARGGDFVAAAAHQVPQRVAAEGVAGEEQGVRRQDQTADADAEMASSRAIGEPERLDRVADENDDEHQ